MKQLFLFLTLFTAVHFTYGQSSYFPQTPGNVLIYSYGSELYQGAYDNMKLKVSTLESTKEISGKTYFVIESATGTDGNYKVNTTSFSRVREDGTLVSKMEQNGEETVVLPSLLKVGQTWSSKSGTLPSTSEVIELDGVIKTPGETYINCLVVEQKDASNIMRSYFKKDVGMVAITMVIEGKEQLFVYLENK